MNSKLHKVLFAVIGGFFFGWCLMWVAQAYGGEYVTYKDPKTGVRYYGDALPPSAPTDVRVEVRQHEGVPSVGSSGWSEAAKGIAPKVPITVRSRGTSYEEKQRADLMRPNPTWDRLMHQSNKPTPPSRDITARDFNRAFDKHRQYDDDMFEWRSRGRELRQQYNDPNGFGRNPTGFSQEEKRYYKSYAP